MTTSQIQGASGGSDDAKQYTLLMADTAEVLFYDWLDLSYPSRSYYVLGTEEMGPCVDRAEEPPKEVALTR